LSSRHKQLLTAIAAGQIEKAKCLTRTGIDLNVPCDRGASVLFCAILSGDDSLVRLMLEHGADPNYAAADPGATIYAEKPLELAEQARFLLSRDKYQPIVELLDQFGATPTSQCEAQHDA
jgi:ankyrin repeat protein